MTLRLYYQNLHTSFHPFPSCIHVFLPWICNERWKKTKESEFSLFWIFNLWVKNLHGQSFNLSPSPTTHCDDGAIKPRVAGLKSNWPFYSVHTYKNLWNVFHVNIFRSFFPNIYNFFCCSSVSKQFLCNWIILCCVFFAYAKSLICVDSPPARGRKNERFHVNEKLQNIFSWRGLELALSALRTVMLCPKPNIN